MAERLLRFNRMNHGKRIGVILDGYQLSGPRITTLHERSRGRHDPGSGEYYHRIVTGGRAFRDDPEWDVIEFCSTFRGSEPVYDGAQDSPIEYWGSWSNGRYTLIQCGKYGSKFACSGFVQDYYEFRPSSRDYDLGLYRMDRMGRLLFSSFEEARAYGQMRYARWISAPSESFPISGYTPGLRLRDASYTWQPPRFSVNLENTILRIGEHDDTFRGVNDATASAYIAAVDSLPDLTHMNNIANAMDLVRAFASFARGFAAPSKTVKGAIKLFKDAWLGYRYGFNCTKADLQEGVSIMERLAELRKSSTFRSNSVVHKDGWVIRCSLECNVLDFEDLYTLAERWGFALSAYNIWDLVPYSFVVDWFTDFGGWIEFCETQSAAARLPTADVWFSIEKTETNEFGDNETYYHRFQWDVCTQAATYSSRGPSGVTIVKRSVDTAALLL